jgi:hypothetical protein
MVDADGCIRRGDGSSGIMKSSLSWKNPSGTVTVLFRSTAPPLVMVRELPLIVLLAVTHSRMDSM